MKGIIIFLIGLCASGIFLLIPIFHTPPPLSGSFWVGLHSIQLTDNNRIEIHANQPDTKRTVMVHFYYPTKQQKQLQPNKFHRIAKQSFVKSIDNRIKASILGILLGQFKSHAIANAPIASNKPAYPVILFSHGIGGYGLYSTYLEQLASNGFIVVYVQHAYDIQSVELENGEIISLSTTLKKAMETNDRKAVYAYREQAHDIWQQDLQFVLEQLKEINSDKQSLFHQKLNLENIGTLGHSHGGGVVTTLTRIDNRIKAGCNMDGWTKNRNQTAGFSKPMLFLVNKNSDLAGINKLHKAMGPKSQKITIPAAGHGAFSDLVLLKQPLARWQGVNDSLIANPHTMVQTISAHLINFFRTHLSR